MKIENPRIHFLSDVFAAVAVLWLITYGFFPK